MFSMTNSMPDAYAKVKGDKDHPSIKGTVYFHEVFGGTIVVAELYGLPDPANTVAGNFYGFHVHTGASCTGDSSDPFKNAAGHYNPKDSEHPRHAGDLPPLLGNKGDAYMSVYTNRFYPEEVVGRTVIIHGMPDDFRTQPSGDSGMKIACGEIVDYHR